MSAAPPNATPLVSLIAVNYNGSSQVDRFLAGVRASDYTQIEVVVVDNASSDDSASLFAAADGVKVVESPENLGYGRGCNLGAEHAHGDLLLFMNPDVDLYPDTISILVRDLLENPDAAIVCATTLDPGKHHERRRRVEDVASMYATTILVERAHFQRLGGFDPWIFLYSEDADLCYRTWLLGRRVLKSWDAVAEHDVGGTGGGHRWSAEQVKNGLYVHLKLRAWPATARYGARMLLKTIVRGVRMRDPAILNAWVVNIRELPQTFAKRRATRGVATPADRDRLEQLGAEHAYWARRSWREGARRAARRRLAAIGGQDGMTESSMHESDLTPAAPSDGAASEGAESTPRVRPAFLHGHHGPFVAMLHATQARPDLGVVICPPFGWEEMSSYRPRREWAQALAHRGIAAVRIDLPGTGDSDGYPTDDDRLDAWTGAIGEAATWLRHETGCRRVVAIGIGVGGLLAYAATAQGASIDDLVLWGTPARGRTFIRELKAFARMEAIQQDKDDKGVSDELPPGWLSAGGYVITAETCAALEGLAVSDLALPAAAGRHALLIERDGISVDGRLREALECQQVSVQTMPGKGYGQMMVEPQLARSPVDTVEQVVEWIAALDPEAAMARAFNGDVPRVSTEAQVHAFDGTLVRESFLTIEHPLGDMFGVLTEPLEQRGELTSLLLGGTGHRIGPNRMWVEAARRWAASGVPSVRLDLAGAGDAGGVQAPDVPALHQPEFTEQLNLALRELERMGLSSHTVTVGLCIGAYWALQASLRTDREVVPLMLNPRVLVWDEGGHVDRMARHYLSELRHASNWKRLLKGEVPIVRALGVLTQRLRRILIRGNQPHGVDQTSTHSEAVDKVLDELRDRGRRGLILFTGLEELLQEFEREGRLEHMEQWPNLTLEVVPGLSDLHTLRQIWLQQKVHRLLDAALDRELTGQTDT